MRAPRAREAPSEELDGRPSQREDLAAAKAASSANAVGRRASSHHSARSAPIRELTTVGPRVLRLAGRQEPLAHVVVPREETFCARAMGAIAARDESGDLTSHQIRL